MIKILSRYQQFLTKNVRNKWYLRKNSIEGRGVADSKWKTKRILAEKGVGVPRLITRFKTVGDINKYRFEKLEGNFVIKPASGYGGEGIIVIRKRGKWAGEWKTMNGEDVSSNDLKLHCKDILSGKYSLYGMADTVLVEERVKIYPKFLRFTRSGTPDVRVIVFNKVPLMAMIRVPTKESNGKANLQQGAMGLGIDMGSGITTFGVSGKSHPITKVYDFERKKLIKVNGIQIPLWDEILETAIKCQTAVDGLGFLGVDIVLDKEKGPQVLELNARPGLSIQICNKAGLLERLKRVEGIKVRNEKHGIALAKYLFAEDFFEKIADKKNKVVVDPLEQIFIKVKKTYKGEEVIKKGKKRLVKVRAKIDTGAFRSSIDRELAERIGLLEEKNILYYRHYRSALGKHNDRPVVGITYYIKGIKVETAISVADRKKLRTKILIGRKDLGGFLVSAVRRKTG